MSAMPLATQAGVRKLRSAGMEEQSAESVVEVVGEAMSALVTRDVLRTELADVRAEMAEFRADIYRALWIQGAGIVAVVGGIVAILEVVG